MVICLERGADLHMAQLMPLLLTVSCFSKIQFGFTFLVPAHPGSPGQRAVKRVCVCVCDAVTAAGCADVTPPRHTWMRRTGDLVQVGCPTTGKRWNLTCVGGRWEGRMGDRCPGVPGVRLPGDMVDDAQPHASHDESFLASFPISKSSTVAARR